MKKLSNKIVSIALAALLTSLLTPPLVWAEIAPAANIPIDQAHFPDEAFREYLLNEPYGSDGTLTPAEIASIKIMGLYGESVADTTGIEYLSALEWFSVSSSWLTEIDVSKNLKLIQLDVSSNFLTELDVSKNIALEQLSFSHNELTSIDVSKNINLQFLDIDDNNFSYLDVSHNLQLNSLECSQNELTSLDVSMISGLGGIGASDNHLATLDLSKNTRLSELDNWVSRQTISATAYSIDSGVTYLVNMQDLVGHANLSRVTLDRGGTYDQATGIVTLDAGNLTSFEYTYDTGNVNLPMKKIVVSLTNSAPPKTTWKRLGGDDRFSTMAEISKERAQTAQTVIITTSNNFPDGLAASSLAGIYDAPILLASPDQNAALDKHTTDEIKRLGATKAIILGDTNAVSAKVEQELQTLLGKGSTKRIYGKDRYSTATAIYKQGIGKFSKTVIITKGTDFPDALSVSPYAYAAKSPVFFVHADGLLDDATTNLVSSALDNGIFNRVLLLGDKTSVSEKVKNQLGKDFTYTRLGGANRYETSGLIAEWTIDKKHNFTNTVITTGLNFPDALCGGSLAGSKKSVLLLTDDSAPALDALKTSLGNKSHLIKQAYILGDSQTITEPLLAKISVIVGGK